MHNDPELVVILDYKGVVTSNPNALQRHQLYGKTLSSMTDGKTKLLILGNNRNWPVPSQVPNLEFISLPSSFRFIPIFIALAMRALWRNRQKIKFIVSGDPWLTLIVAKIIRNLLKAKIQLQVQLHGDFFSCAWRGLSFRNRVASRFLPIFLKNCQSIRVVSSSQARDLVDLCNIELNRIVCVPLPLNVPKIPHVNPRRDNLPFAFVGRIEEERGLKNLLYLIELLPEMFKTRGLWISGSGSKRVSLEREIERFLPSNSFEFKHELDAEQLVSMWSGVGTLLSLAPAESYGLAMREAIVNGVPVLAVRSTGSMELNQFLNGSGIILADEPFQREKIAEQLKILNNLQISESTRKALFSESANFVEILCSSWLRTTAK